MFVNVNSARIFFDTVGSGLAIEGEIMRQKPTLIVMHGGPGFDHSTLRPYFDRFADTHQVVYIDHRGNGRSSGDISTWNLGQWGDDVKAFCDALGIEKPVVYGNSFGGMVAMSYGARHPEHPSKLIFSSTMARTRLDITFQMMEAHGGKEARAVAERFWATPDDAAFAEYARVCLPLYNPPAEGQAALDAVGLKRAILKPEVTRHFSLGEMKDMDNLGSLAAVQCPALVLAGTYDPITPVVCSEEIVAALPKDKVRFELFEGAGHGVHRDQPDQAERVIRAFLA